MLWANMLINVWVTINTLNQQKRWVQHFARERGRKATWRALQQRMLKEAHSGKHAPRKDFATFDGTVNYNATTALYRGETRRQE